MNSDSEVANETEETHQSQPPSAAMVSLKVPFLEWLEGSNKKKCSPALAEDCFDRTSNYSIQKKVCQTALWNVTDYAVFKSVYSKLVSDKFFRIHDKSNYKLFLLVGKLYSTFLEQKPMPKKDELISKRSEETMSPLNDSQKRQNTLLLTVKEACVSALRSTKYGMTIEQIYKKIIEEGFYDFRVLNPESVIRAEIERVCENAGYAPRMSNKYIFRFERNQVGEKLYFLLSNIPLNYFPRDPTDTKTRSEEPETDSPSSLKIEIWNKSIERDFRAWMESKNYVPYTINIYSRTIDHIVNHFTKLLDTAVYKSTTMTEAASIFIELLRQDQNFEAKSAKNRQFSTSLAAFERFIGSESSNSSSEAIHTNIAKTDNRYESGKTDSESSKIEIWNKSIERDFRAWMESKNYSSSTAGVYFSSINQAIKSFKILADIATSRSSTMYEAARLFVALVQKGTRSASSKKKSPYSAALAAYARFIDENSPIQASSTSKPNEAAIDDMPLPKVEKPETPKIEIWNMSIEKDFRAWMEAEKYTSSAIGINCGAINKIIERFKTVENIAVSKSSTVHEAARRFINLINQDSGFVAIELSWEKHLYSAALNTFARFIDESCPIQVPSTSKPNEAAIDNMPLPKVEKAETPKIEIWNKSIERDFRAWMESKNYSSSTAGVYFSSINQAIKSFKILADIATSRSSTMYEAARLFVALVQKGTRSASSKKKSPYSAALAAYARFIDENSPIQASSTSKPNEAAIDDMPLPKVEKPETPKIEIWNKSIEREFRAWMEIEKYPPYTIETHCRAINETIERFKTMVEMVVSKSSTIPEAARSFINLIYQDSDFVVADLSWDKHPYSAALNTFARFINLNSSIRTLSISGPNEAVIDDMPLPIAEKAETPKIEIWNKSIERGFRTWMRKKNYASSNIGLYRSYVEKIMVDFSTLVNQATRESKTMPEAARKFTFLLGQSREFEAKASINPKFKTVLAMYSEFVHNIDPAGLLEPPIPKETHIFKEHESEVDELLRTKVAKVLSSSFPNGFRLNSIIELKRFRRFAADTLSEDVALSDEDLKSVISACGRLFEGKIYVVSAETENRIKQMVDEAFASGMRAIFYQTFYEKNEDWLFPASIVSAKMLEDIFQKLFRSSSGYIHKKNNISKRSYTRDELTMIKTEIVRVWEEDVLISYSQLAERLPYIPFEKIKSVLNYNSDFIRNSDGVYTHITKVDITRDERSIIANFAAERCASNGYVSMNDIPLSEIEERNHELTLIAIQNAAFQICLSKKHDKKGKIVTRKGGSLNALTIMKDYCRKLDKCSLDDLLSFQEELVGQRENQSTAMESAYAVLVRVGKSTFLAEKFVDFDTIEIDNAIDLFVKGDYLPLKSFTTFVAFPHCGQPWNLFLLESYCRRFSERFRFDTPSVNSRNAGTVIRRSCVLTYVEIMADAVARSGISYEKKAIGKFLYEKGYTGKTITAKASEIIEKAKAIRERKD